MAELDLKFASSPRVLFETSVMKACMPQADYDIEALLARIAALEAKVENGISVAPVATQSPVQASAQVPVQTPLVEEKTPACEEEQGGYFDDVPPPMEEPIFDETPYIPPQETKAAKAEKPVPAPAKTIQKPAMGDAKGTFGAFLRSLRRTGKSGVLFAICMDLDYAIEDGVFTLITDSETMYASMTRADHYPIIKRAFEEIGIAEDGFTITLKGKPKDEFAKKMAELRASFPDTKIEIK